MNLNHGVNFPKSVLICYGSRALRVAERFLRKWRKQIKTPAFQMDLSDQEQSQLLCSITVKPIISYPHDLESLPKDVDIVFQIILKEDNLANLSLAREKYNKIPNITIVI